MTVSGFDEYLLTLTDTRRRLLLEKIKAYGDAYAKSNESTDERLLVLPHHKRVKLCNALAVEHEFLERFAPEAVASVGAMGATRAYVATVFRQLHPELSFGMYQGDYNVLCDVALRMMIHQGRIRFFQTTDSLEAMLQATDFGKDCPSEWFRPPFPDIYIEFGEHHNFPVKIKDPKSGEHIIEGVYVLSGEGEVLDCEHKTLSRARGFEIIVFGSPIGKSGVMDDCYTHMSVTIDNESASILELVQKTVDSHRRKSNFLNSEIFAPVIEHVAKILIYLGTREARQREVNDLQQAEKKLRGLKSPSKVAKSIRQNARLYDRVVIGPDSLGDGEGENSRDGERGVAPHVRRGHLRSQAYGPQHSLRRPQWIQPTFVGGVGWGSGGVPSPSYVVR